LGESLVQDMKIPNNNKNNKFFISCCILVQYLGGWLTYRFAFRLKYGVFIHTITYGEVRLILTSETKSVVKITNGFGKLWSNPINLFFSEFWSGKKSKPQIKRLSLYRFNGLPFQSYSSI